MEILSRPYALVAKRDAGLLGRLPESILVIGKAKLEMDLTWIGAEEDGKVRHLFLVDYTLFDRYDFQH